MAGVGDKRRHLREIISRREIGLLPGVYDGYSLKLVERYGFEAANVSGAGLANSRLAKPDIGVMGLEPNLAACRALCSATGIPLLADGDTGYGNAMNVYYATQGFEQAGVAGIFFEDQVSPKRCGHLRGKTVISAEEMAGKILAATDAREDPEMVLMARTDAAARHGVREVIDRANLYLEAGADIIFPDAIESYEDIELVAREVAGPTCINMGFGLRSRVTTPLVTPRSLEACGVSLVFYARMLSSAAIQGMSLALEAFREQIRSGQIVERHDLCVGFEDVEGLVGVDEALSLSEGYAGEGPRVRRVVARTTA